MLVIAVLACLILRDGDDGAGKTRLEVTGKLEGLTNHQGDTALPAAPSLIKDVKAEKGDSAQPVKDDAASEKDDAKALAPEDKKAEPSRELASAKVKVLALAKAAAEKRQIPAQTSEKLDMPKAVEDAAAPAPAEPVVEPAAAPVVVEAPATPKAAPAPAKKVEKTAEKAPAKTSAPSSPVVLKKFEGSRIEVDPVEARVAALKAEARKPAVKKAPAPRLSAVESALADARAGRLAPEKIAAAKPAPEKSAAEKPASYDRVVTSARFVMQGSLIKLVLKGNAPMVGHYYVLESPDRVVLDLAGNWQIELPKVPSNRLIKAVRVGQHDDKTRLVFDMKTTGKVALVPLNRNSLELHIR